MNDSPFNGQDINIDPVTNERLAQQSNSPTMRNLIVSLASDDHNAFRVLYEKFYPAIVGFLRHFTSCSEDAEELGQDTFAYIWEKRSHLDPDRNIKSYIYLKAKHLLYDYLRRKQTHGRFSDELSHMGDETSVAADAIIAERELRLLIELTVSSMPRVRRQVFEMSNREGMSTDEIAEKLGISRDSVWMHLSRARKDIQSVISSFVSIFLIS